METGNPDFGRRVRAVFWLGLLLICAVGSAAGAAEEPRPVELRNDTWAVRITPESLEVTATPAGKGPVQLSAPQGGLGAVQGLRRAAGEVSWTFSPGGPDVSFRLDDDSLDVRFVSEAAGRFTWPVLEGEPTVKAYVAPFFEGSYVPCDDADWRAFLVGLGPVSTTEGLSMPFWGLDCGGLTATYIVTNPFNNELAFDDNSGRLGLRLTHEFGANRANSEWGLVVKVGSGSPVEPARQYRRWLVGRGEFVSLRDKIRKVPNAEKLLGAAHVYLWGAALLSRYDVSDWRRLVAGLADAGASDRPSPGRRIWDLMSAEGRQTALDAVSSGSVSAYARGQLAQELSGVLERRDLYDSEAWSGVQLPPEAAELLGSGVADLDEARLLRLNCLLFETAFAGQVIPSKLWGDGVSVKMMDKLAAAGLDRLWLGLDSWQGGFRHPQAIRMAEELGYLVATYDSYESIHSPDEPDTWETAQFDAALYETGAVVGRDGAKRPGFMKKGYRLSPIAARPYVEKRVKGLMGMLPVPFNSWFVDCDAFGDLCDDFSPLHPATQQDDMKARLGRMAWIRDTYGLVVGSEGGAAYAAPVIHFVHGMMTPVIGWGDPDLQKDKESQYYLGAYWPPDGPAVFVKQVPLKEKYRTLYFDPRFRLPLYQTVFHDSLVATHHWSSGSLKFKDQVVTVELLELLYNVPPLYHLNLREFEQHGDRIRAHYAFFSPLHRELALRPMTEFEWLNPDRTVQRTGFAGEVEMVANFSQAGFSYGGTEVPAQSIMARWVKTGACQVFTPAPAD
jgi:hypothetical protein